MQPPTVSFGHEVDMQFQSLSQKAIAALFSNNMVDMIEAGMGIRYLLVSVRGLHGRLGLSAPQKTWVHLILLLETSLSERYGVVSDVLVTYGDLII